MNSRFGLKESAISELHGVLARHPEVQRAILYGSRAKGTHSTGSDIDLTLVGDERLNLDVLLRIMEEMDELLQPYTLDLSLLASITDPEVLDHIHRVGVVFYDKVRDNLQEEAQEKGIQSTEQAEPRGSAKNRRSGAGCCP
ncbi:nucleotidyltransferase domain-containing protein [Desulfonatronum thioautotrophicum]|uniref:nucleotidyltransferase domain-containing protein n=1 Tax=Desulfonatronum thioautotrophicum TaxID=617001 RepID=UPI0005EB3B27|nr:nucleotidyltransferase domain-containing protein [Desulfonatronum thioautotrophicum]